MHRLSFPLLPGSWILSLLLVPLLAIRAPAAMRPNVVLIISDDQTYRDFGFMGNREVHTPHLDRLAGQSVRFPNGYVPTSVCSPSLATLLTGLYPHQNGIHYNHPPPGNAAFNRMKTRAEYERVRSRSFYLIRRQPTLPRVLAGAGYRCLQTGKFWEGHFSNAGFTEGMTLFEPPIGQSYGGLRKLAGGEPAAHGNGDWGLRIGRETMEPIFRFIDDCAGRDPFFVWYAPYLPHQPHDSPRKYFERYQNQPGVPAHRVPYYASISQFDDTVGELVAHVAKRGLLDQTLFVFVVDNGWTPGTRRHPKDESFYYHTEESKRSPFEDGLRTPILLRWDGVLRPGTHEGLVSSIDLVPTILAAAGLPRAIPDLPGINLLPVGRGESVTKPDRAVFGEIYPGDARALGRPSGDIAYRWVRQGDYKLIVAHALRGGEPWGKYLQGDALYHLTDDPGESRNLMNDQGQGDRVARLRRLLDQWWTPGDDSQVLKP